MFVSKGSLLYSPYILDWPKWVCSHYPIPVCSNKLTNKRWYISDVVKSDLNAPGKYTHLIYIVDSVVFSSVVAFYTFAHVLRLCLAELRVTLDGNPFYMGRCKILPNPDGKLMAMAKKLALLGSGYGRIGWCFNAFFFFFNAVLFPLWISLSLCKALINVLPKA